MRNKHHFPVVSREVYFIKLLGTGEKKPKKGTQLLFIDRYHYGILISGMQMYVSGQQFS